MLQHPRYSKVPDLDLSLRRHEDILLLQISVQDPLVVNMLNGQAHLHEPVQNLVLGDQLLHLLLILDFLVHVAAVRVVHHDAQVLVVHETLSVGDDVGVSHGFQHFDLTRKKIRNLLRSGRPVSAFFPCCPH